MEPAILEYLKVNVNPSFLWEGIRETGLYKTPPDC
jgi:hypothetical protein